MRHRVEMQEQPTVEHPLLLYFDKRTNERGSDYFRRGKVVGIGLDNFLLQASVTGSGENPPLYRCDIAFSPDMSKIKTTLCTCPVLFRCKHSSAAVMTFLFGATNPVPSSARIELIRPTPVLSIEEVVCRQAVLISDEGAHAFPGDKLRILSLTGVINRAKEKPESAESGKKIVQQPDPAAVSFFCRQLRAFGFEEVYEVMFDKVKQRGRLFAGQPEAWIMLTHRLPHLKEDGWLIPDATEESLRPIQLTDADLNFRVRDDGGWWFSLSLDIEVQGRQVPLLPLLVSALRTLPSSLNITDVLDDLNKDGKFIAALPTGQLVSMPFDRIRPILISIQELTSKDRFSLSEMERLMGEPLLSAAKWTGADRLRMLVEKLGKLRHIECLEPPKEFKAELRPYQLEGMSWLQFLAESEFGGILAEDMGLGKTVELLAHIALEKERGRLTAPFLVVCPTSVMPNWLSEIRKFTPHLKTIAYSGADRMEVFDALRYADIIVSTYPTVQRDEELLKYVNWHAIALDEAQAIKNPKTKVAKALRSFTAKHRFCLTGTPIENHLGELWSQFHFLLPGLLGDHRLFKTEIQKPIEMFGNQGMALMLSHRIRPFVLRRTKEQVAADLPEKTIIIKEIELGEGQRDLYETVRLASTDRVRDEIERKGFKQSHIVILDALLKLRQACCDPRLVKLTVARQTEKSAKLEELINMLQELCEEKRKILVFSQFTSMLDLIKIELDQFGLRYVELRGDTNDRQRPVEQFQETDVPIFLISLKAGGTGLNLTAADTVIHYDPWWNPAVENQATDRAHRIGQTKNVFVYKLIAKGTVEERMLQLQEQKRILAECIYDQRGNGNLAFSEMDIEVLLRPIEKLLGLDE